MHLFLYTYIIDYLWYLMQGKSCVNSYMVLLREWQKLCVSLCMLSSDPFLFYFPSVVAWTDKYRHGDLGRLLCSVFSLEKLRDGLFHKTSKDCPFARKWTSPVRGERLSLVVACSGLCLGKGSLPQETVRWCLNLPEAWRVFLKSRDSTVSLAW